VFFCFLLAAAGTPSEQQSKTSLHTVNMLRALFLLSQLLTAAVSEPTSLSSLITPCREGAPAPINIGRRGKVVYYTWNNQSSKFNQHCNFNREKSLAGEKYMFDNFEPIPQLLQRPKKGQGQAKQDTIMARMFSAYPNPFYVDMASNHWIYISNTYMLDSVFKWQGICIEPTSDYLAGLVVNRTCTVVQSVVGGHDNDIIEYAHHGSLGGIIGKDKSSGMDNYAADAAMMSKTLQREVLHTVSLTTILRAFQAPSVIEYLSLDVSCVSPLFPQVYFLCIS
jgi:hypothetical protein